jgi:hypothetical protein
MLEPETTAILTGAAGNIVAYMFNGRIDALRAWVSQIFRGEPEEQRSQPLRTLEKDAAALAGRDISEADVKARWSIILTSYLTAHPEALSDIKALASTPVESRSISIGEQHNHGSGTFIGGDNYGSVNTPAGREP